jgi:hypothetical protein
MCPLNYEHFRFVKSYDDIIMIRDDLRFMQFSGVGFFFDEEGVVIYT